MKSQIIEELGQTEILLPARIAQGLAANDRVKVRLSVLQAAARHAHDPAGSRFNLNDECRQAGIDTMAMEALVNSAALIADARILATGLRALEAAIWGDVEAMIDAVRAGDPEAGDSARQRLTVLRSAASPQPADTLELSQIGRLTHISGGNGGSLHRLVMDLHKALNRLAAEHAEEEFAGAHVHGLSAQDRPVVEAFMRGLDATRKLKFDHPGLATTAARAGARLIIQNDIGETDAHVVVIAVDGDTVTVTYTDVHLARARFFTGLFRDFAVQWSGLDRKSAEGLGDDGVFYLVTGQFIASDTKARDAFLETIGASLVFLIDWNKARKVLRNWIAKADAIAVLDWAARHRVGHRGFLALGGDELVASAVHHATPTRIGFGERLDHALGREAAMDFLKTVLRVSAEALLEGGSVRLARDRIEADLVRHLQRVDRLLLAIVVRQTGLARDIAAGIAQFIAEQQATRPFDRAALAAQAHHIEEKADRIALDARQEIERFEADRSIELLVNQAEQTIDELEQAAFIASLVPEAIDAKLLAPLATLCAAAVEGAEAAATGASAAADVPDGRQIDSEDAFAAIARLIEAEHEGDRAERAITAIVLRGDFDQKTALSVLELTRAIERATDRFAGFGHLLRERVLADLKT
ncbi:MAG: hypothetical protein GC182_16400 [Rhodopseudomonas sp.]|nr:hypothetical protein [Rhodopseudomonas sp.]